MDLFQDNPSVINAEKRLLDKLEKNLDFERLSINTQLTQDSSASQTTELRLKQVKIPDSVWESLDVYHKISLLVAIKVYCYSPDEIHPLAVHSLNIEFLHHKFTSEINDYLYPIVFRETHKNVDEFSPEYYEGKLLFCNDYYSWNRKEMLSLCMKDFINGSKKVKGNFNSNSYDARCQYTINDIIENKVLQRNYRKSETKFRGIETKSPGHKKLCETLRDAGYMFLFEAPCNLPDDLQQHRRLDLIVIGNQRAVIVEVDGGTHRTVEGQRDDYERDRLIAKHWPKRLRLEHSDVENKTQECMEKIISELDPLSGVI